MSQFGRSKDQEFKVVPRSNVKNFRTSYLMT